MHVYVYEYSQLNACGETSGASGTFREGKMGTVDVANSNLLDGDKPPLALPIGHVCFRSVEELDLFAEEDRTGRQGCLVERVSEGNHRGAAAQHRRLSWGGRNLVLWVLDFLSFVHRRSMQL